jgi:hypothetical protein
MCRSHRQSYQHEATDAVATVAIATRGSRWPYGGADRSVRASDKDREAVIALLNEHTAAGRLTLAEFEERVSSAYVAQLVSDLDGLLSDLPVLRSAAVEPIRRAPERTVNWGPWVLAGMITVVIWVLTSIAAGQVLYPWPLWVVGPWGLVLLSRAMSHRTRSISS